MSIIDRHFERLYEEIGELKSEARTDYYSAFESIFIKYGAHAEALLLILESLEKELKSHHEL